MEYVFIEFASSNVEGKIRAALYMQKITCRLLFFVFGSPGNSVVKLLSRCRSCTHEQTHAFSGCVKVDETF